MTFLDSRYSYITSIGSLTYLSTLSFVYGIEFHGRGLAEGPAMVLWGMLELNLKFLKAKENVDLMSMKYLDNVSERIKLMFLIWPLSGNFKVALLRAFYHPHLQWNL